MIAVAVAVAVTVAARAATKAYSHISRSRRALARRAIDLAPGWTTCPGVPGWDSPGRLPSLLTAAVLRSKSMPTHPPGVEAAAAAIPTEGDRQ